MPRTGGRSRLVIEYAEGRVFASRSGKGGCVQEDVRGVVAAAFDHWDSRAGDPQLHTHVVVMNRVQTLDGVWRTIDSKALFRWTVGLSELYQGLLSDCLTEALGWGWEPRERAHSPVPQVGGGRGAAGADGRVLPTLVGDRAGQGRDGGRVRRRPRAAADRAGGDPDAAAGHPARPAPRSTSGRWRSWCRGGGRGPARSSGPEQTAWVAGAGRAQRPAATAGHGSGARRCWPRSPGSRSVSVAGHRATFTRPNVYAEVLRQLHGVRFAGPAERIAVAERADRPGDGAGAAAHPTRRRGAARSGCGARTGRPGCGPGTARSTPPSRSSTPRPGSSTPADATDGRRRRPRGRAGRCAPRRWTRPGGCCRPTRPPPWSRW